jgi:uncharacterized membrane protein (UPF0127 family)
MSRRARLAIAAVVAVVSGIGIVVLVVQFASSGNDDSHLPVDFERRAAAAPFTGYRETRVDVDGRCRRVAVADTNALRADGLRDHVKLGPYAGMVFVFDGDTSSSFTMAGVTDPLEIAWYAADGTRVDGAHMAPCPDRGQAECPIYSSRARYRYAFERPGGSAPPSALTACS